MAPCRRRRAARSRWTTGALGRDVGDLKRRTTMSGISRDVKNHYTALQSIVPSTISSGTTNGTGVDMDNTDGGFATLEVGAVTALTTLDVALQESDTSGGAYTALPVVAAFPTVTTANKVAVINFLR